MNVATGYVATIPGGSNNWASGPYSFAAGYAATVSGEKSFALGSNINCTADSAFVWSDGSGTVTGIGLSRSFNVKASRGTRIWTSSDISSGVTIGAGGNAWVQVSDSTKKQRIRPLDTQDILTRFSSLPLKRWEYKSEEQGTEHVGPMAQDFWNSFHLGNEPLGISTIDADGVMMAAIQGLYQEVIELRARVQTLEAAEQKAVKEEK